MEGDYFSHTAYHKPVSRPPHAKMRLVQTGVPRIYSFVTAIASDANLHEEIRKYERGGNHQNAVHALIVGGDGWYLPTSQTRQYASTSHIDWVGQCD